jgi:hypothetical protein
MRADVNAAEEIDFNDQIRPILLEHCFACHGPDSAKRKGDLRLDIRQGAAESDAIVPGKPDDSELITRINSDDPDMVMPPPKAEKQLSARQKQLLRDWIARGAEWQDHWSFMRPVRKDPPKSAAAEAWARTPIDYFIFARLAEQKLQPNPPADRYTLARRAALDVTGLPPTWETVQRFADDQTENAYAKYLDALFASEHAGEHRARFWLDAARYGDTHGMHVDNYREIWPYRDWVVRAFNNNMPFDQFVVEQLAGDLLPGATLEQRIATGFNRCNITTSEGGAIPAELDVRYMVDRVETTATVFLGLTAGCAVCHDHKYDPVSQREFYQLGAFFNNTTQPAMDGNQKDTPPVVALPPEEHQGEWNAIQETRSRLRDRLASIEIDAAKWWPTRIKELAHPVGDNDLITWRPLIESQAAEAALPKNASWAVDHPAGRRGIRFGDEGQLSIESPVVRTDEPLSISFWVRTPDRLISTTLFDQTGKTKDKKTLGWKITCNAQGALIFEMFDPTGKKIRGVLPDNEALTPRTWQHVCVRYSGGLSNSSISVIVDGKQGSLRNSSEAYIEAAPLAETPLLVGSRLPTGGMSDLRIFRRWLLDEEVKLLSRDHQLAELASSARGWSDLKPDEQSLVSSWRRQLDADYQTAARELAATARRRDFIYSHSTTTLVMEERPTPPRAYVLERGEYDKRRDQVAPDVPAVMPPLPDGPSNRLALAKWLVRPDHPLTARVTVNRLWQSIFGVGLVRTAEDFGVMGERPTHPELLDWLAVEFIESGWDVNHILKLMLNSAAYRQSSVVAAEHLRGDRNNRLLSRGPRLRLDAEILRDQTLAISGLLKRRIGGPSVRPYQPAGLWRVVAITGSNTRDFKRDDGDALYRRSVYTFWKRTSPPPSMAAFNAPTREQCTVRRERTNTPLQALVMMNDPQYIEAARHLAERSIAQHKDDMSRVRWMLENVLCRPAAEFDVKESMLAAAAFLEIFAADKEAAAKLIVTGDSKPNPKLDAAEVAAWTMVANMLMNRDDYINK